MGSTAPIPTKCFIKFLEYRGCQPARGTNHTKWKCKGCKRSIIFDRSTKQVPYLHVKDQLESNQCHLE